MQKKAQTNHELRKPAANSHDKWEARLRTERSDRVTWSDCDAGDLLAALVAVTADGAALLLSQTSDGGALSIHVLTRRGTHKLYPARMEELTEALSLITEIAGT